MNLTSPAVRGALWMGGAVLSFTAMAIAVRELQRHMGSFEIVFLRSLVMLAIVLAIAAVWLAPNRRRMVVYLALGTIVAFVLAHRLAALANGVQSPAYLLDQFFTLTHHRLLSAAAARWRGLRGAPHTTSTCRPLQARARSRWLPPAPAKPCASVADNRSS